MKPGIFNTFLFLCYAVQTIETFATNAEYNGIVMLTEHDKRYDDISEITLPNKKVRFTHSDSGLPWFSGLKITAFCVQIYAEHHGYPLIVKTSWYLDEQGHNSSLHTAMNEIGGLVKCGMIREIFKTYPNCSWVFYCDADAVITDPNIKLDSFTADAKHFVAAADLNAPNAGNFFLRNSHIGKAWLNMMCAAIPIYRTSGWYENMFFLDAWHTTHLRDVVMTVLPQRSFNAYDFATTDIMGTPGQWEPGCFMAHFAGQSHLNKLALVKKYLAFVKAFNE